MFNFWWLAEWSEQKTLTKTEKNEKGPLSHRKIKCLFLDYIQLLMIGRAIWAKKCWPKHKKWKRPPRSLKNKMFVFWIMFNFWWSAEWSEQITLTEAQKNEKSPPSHWKIKCLFLDSTSDDRLSEAWPKCKEMPPKSAFCDLSKKCSKSASDLSKKRWPKCKKMKKAP